MVKLHEYGYTGMRELHEYRYSKIKKLFEYGWFGVKDTNDYEYFKSKNHHGYEYFMTKKPYKNKYLVMKKRDGDVQGRHGFQTFGNCGQVFIIIRASWLYIWGTLYLNKGVISCFLYCKSARL